MIHKKLFYSLVVILLHNNLYAQQFEEAFFAELPHVKQSTFISHDFNNDGFSDLVISGLDENNLPVFKLLIRQDDRWITWNTGISALLSSSIMLADVNHDNNVDIIYNGKTLQNEDIVKVYLNKGNHPWIDATQNLPQLENATVFWGDIYSTGNEELFLSGKISDSFTKALSCSYKNDNWVTNEINLPIFENGDIQLFDGNNDGYLDLLITGRNQFFQYLSQLFIYKGNYEWESVSHNITIGPECKTRMADFNNDGQLDIIYSYFGNAGTPKTKVYLNHNGTFQETDLNLPNIAGGALEVKDLNDDNWSDILISGVNSSGIRINNLWVNKNTFFEKSPIDFEPIAGGDLCIIDYNNDNFLDLIFSGETYLGTNTLIYENHSSHSLIDINEPINLTTEINERSVTFYWDNDSDVQGSYLFINKENDFRDSQLKTGIYNSKAIINGLVGGKYYWTVINEGTAINYSKYAEVDSFYICEKPFLGNDFLACRNSDILLKNPQQNSTSKWYSLGGELLSKENEMTLLFEDTISIVLESTNLYSCIGKDTITIYPYQMPNYQLEDKQVCENEWVELKSDPDWHLTNWYFNSLDSVMVLDQWYHPYFPDESCNIIGEFITSEGCILYDTMTIQLIDLPIFSLGEDRQECYGENITLQIPISEDKNEIEWFSSFYGLIENQTNTYTFSIEEDEQVWVTVTNSNACTFTDTIHFQKNDLPEFELEDTLFYCINNEVVLEIGDFEDSVIWKREYSTNIEEGYIFRGYFETTEKVYCKRYNENGCFWEDSVVILPNELPESQLEQEYFVCPEEELTLQINDEFKSILWYKGEDEIKVENPTELTLSTSENQYIYLFLESYEGCFTMDTIQISVNENPIADAGENTTICTSGNVVLGSENFENFTYRWSPETNLSNAFIANPIASPIVTTTYYLQVSDQNQCQSTYDSVTVYVNEFYGVNAGTDKEICLGEGVELGGYPIIDGGSGDYSITWFLNEENHEEHPFVIPFESQDYILKVSLEDCLTYYDTVRINVNPPPKLSISEDLAIGYNGEATLEANGAKYYFWSPDYHIDQTNIGKPTVSPKVTTTYTVEGISELGCSSKASVTVHVGNEVFVPNLFTPNNDGNNDHFKVYGKGIELLSFIIKDKVGNTVYQSTNKVQILEIGWDGKVAGNFLPNGTYYWEMDGEFTDGSAVVYKGNNYGVINLIR